MITFEVQIEASSCSHGWATVIVRAKDRVLKIQCSHIGGDSIRDLAKAFGQLVDVENKKIEIVCYEEPQDSLIILKRKGSNLEVVIKRYTCEFDSATDGTISRAMNTMKTRDWERMRRSRNRKAKLRQIGPFVVAMNSLAVSLQRIEDEMGSEEYERSWGFAFPTVELTAMKEYLSRGSVNGTGSGE